MAFLHIVLPVRSSLGSSTSVSPTVQSAASLAPSNYSLIVVATHMRCSIVAQTQDLPSTMVALHDTSRVAI